MNLLNLCSMEMLHLNATTKETLIMMMMSLLTTNTLIIQNLVTLIIVHIGSGRDILQAENLQKLPININLRNLRSFDFQSLISIENRQSYTSVPATDIQTLKTQGTRVVNRIVTDLFHMNCHRRSDFRPPDDIVDFHTEIVLARYDSLVNKQLAGMTIQPKHTNTALITSA